MKRRLLLNIILALLVLFLIGCEKGEALSTDTLIDSDYGSFDTTKINQYKIEIDIDDKSKSYTGNQTTSFFNNSTVSLDEVYFHIYPNAFRTLETAPILFDQQFEDPLSYKGGYINIINVEGANKSLEFTTTGIDNTLLNIKLKEPLLPLETVDIYLEFEVKLPTTKDRFGYSDRVMNFGNWYPIICVYDDNGWNLEPYYKLGDPFYSETSNYKVRITTDKDIVIATSGNIVNEEINNEKKTYNIEGRLLRDFAFVASKEFKVKEEIVDNTLVKLYYLDKRSSVLNYALKSSTESLRIFNRIFGKYPYGQYSVVMTDFPSGMEYPGIVFIGNDYFIYSRREALEQIIVHETAHQWWYGLIGSNQIKEAWLDEGLTTYSEVIYTREAYGREKGDKYLVKNIKEGYEYGKMYLGKDLRINKHLSEFYSWDDYGILVYTKGAMFINQIEEKYGEEVLYNILNKYFNEYKFRNATTEDFIRICEEVTNDSFYGLVEEWLN